MKDAIPHTTIISTSTTSFCLGKVRGLTIYLLYQLRNGPRRCSELAEITGKPYKHVWQYLKNMQNYGLIRKRGSFYEITILGADFLNYYMSHINHIISISKEYQKKVKRKSKVGVPKSLNSSPFTCGSKNLAFPSTTPKRK